MRGGGIYGTHHDGPSRAHSSFLSVAFSIASFTACLNSLFILFKFHYLAKDGILEFLVFPMLPRNQRVRTVLSTAESQTSGKKNGISYINAPYEFRFQPVSFMPIYE